MQGQPFIFNRANIPFITGKKKQLSSPLVLLLMGVGLPLFGLFVGYILVFDDLITQLRIDQDYKAAEARITDGYSTTRYAIFTTYNLDYRYEVNGSDYEGSQWVSGDLWNDIRIGDEITVRYAADDPAASYIAGETVFSSGRLLWTLLSFGFFGLMLFGGLAGVITEMRRLRLSRSGQIIPGKLIRVTEARASRGGMVMYSVVFEFLTPDGRRLEKKQRVADAVTNNYRPSPTPGTSVLILYHSERNLLVL